MPSWAKKILPVWVTSLDRGRPVAGAQVQISTCAGHLQAQGLTDGDGLLLLPDIVREAPQCNGEAESGNWFISARAEGDMAFYLEQLAARD